MRDVAKKNVGFTVTSPNNLHDIYIYEIIPRIFLNQTFDKSNKDYE